MYDAIYRIQILGPVIGQYKSLRYLDHLTRTGNKNKLMLISSRFIKLIPVNYLNAFALICAIDQFQNS
jgi:hypothetical protein